MASSTIRPEGFIPWKLRWWATFLVTIVNVVFITTIVVLLAISKSNSGFATISSSSVLQLSFLGVNLGKLDKNSAYSLLWTSFPTLIITVYVLCWSAIISDFQDRQPFIELAKPDGATGKMSVLLDYRQHALPTRWFRAWRNKHRVLGVAILLTFVNKLALIALASHLLAVESTPSTRPADMLLTTTFNETGVDSRTNLASALNLVLATRNLDARFPPWTLDRYAFPQFNSATASKLGTQLAVNLTAYSADLDCITLPDYSSSNTSDETSMTVIFSGTDRGCAYRQTVVVDNAAATEYITASAETANCGGSSRLLLIHGYFDANAANRLSDLKVISCIPSYWKTQGSLSISAAEPPQPPAIVGFKPDGVSTSFQWSSSDLFETGVQLVVALDPTAAISGNTFGLLALNHARKFDPNLRPTSADLINATTEIFQSTFAFTAKSFLLQSTTTPVTVKGASLTQVSRLTVVTWVAGLMLGILFLITMWTIIVGIQSHRAISILKEEPQGLLGLALLLPPPDSTLLNSSHLSSSSLSPASTIGGSRAGSPTGFCTWLVSEFWTRGGYSQGLTFEHIIEANGVKEKIFVAQECGGKADGKRVIMEHPVETREYKVTRDPS
ncbi:hypothetical protein DL95DRAFT_400209 [Leptodontidium sp. 2 PMI_412]|nr:hypothetical protein DL95DRAFT_400209 [Leptodontidium sp. 2 PMI_412]